MAQQALADEVGVSRTAVSQWEAGEDPTLNNLRKLQKILDVTFSIDETLGGFELVPMNPRTLEYLEVRGEVRERAWIEMEQPSLREPRRIPVIPNRKYAKAPQYALEVSGNSANKVVEDGEHVIVASWPELGRDPIDGDLVVVRRERAMTYEVTIKRVHHNGDRVELRPESDDKAYQTTFVLDPSNREIKVKIIGLVIGKYTDL